MRAWISYPLLLTGLIGMWLILNESISFEQGQQLVGDGTADAISFGRPYIANPDLVERFRAGAPLAEFSLSKLYTDGPEGFIDYPPMTVDA